MTQTVTSLTLFHRRLSSCLWMYSDQPVWEYSGRLVSVYSLHLPLLQSLYLWPRSVHRRLGNTCLLAASSLRRFQRPPPEYESCGPRRPRKFVSHTCTLHHVSIRFLCFDTGNLVVHWSHLVSTSSLPDSSSNRNSSNAARRLSCTSSRKLLVAVMLWFVIQ